MALKLGELVTYLRTDNTALDRGIAAAQDKLKAAGERAREYGPLIGGALAAGLGAGLMSAINVDGAKAKLTAQLGGGQFATDMGKVAGAVYARGFGESLEAVNETLRGVLTSGLIDENATSAEIEAVTVKAQSLADVFGQDVTQTARAAGQMIRTGMAKDSAEAFDILTKGFQVGGDHAGDLLDTFSEYSTQFRKLGLDGPAALGLINQGLKAGARDADTVADALKEFSIRAVDGSKAASDAYKTLGLDAEEMTAQIARGGADAEAGLYIVLDALREMEDPVKREAAAVGLFGTKAEDLGEALYSLNPDTAASALGKVGGAADEMGKTVEQSASQKLEALKRQVQGALVEKLGEAVPYIQATFGWLKDNSEWVTPLATALGILSAAIGVAVLVQKAWNAALLLSPVTWIVLGIGLIVGGLILLATKTTVFQDAWKWAWGGIKSAALAVGRWFRDTLWGDWIKGTWDSILKKGGQALAWFQGLKGRLKSALSGAFDGLKTALRNALNWIISRWNNFSLTLGGGSVLGMDIPSVTLNTPNIPMLAKGGIVPPTRGGRLVGVAEAGEAEAIAPLSKLRKLIEDAVVTTPKKVAEDPRSEPVTEVHVYLGMRELKELVDVQIKQKTRQAKRAAGPRPAASAAAAAAARARAALR